MGQNLKIPPFLGLCFPICLELPNISEKIQDLRFLRLQWALLLLWKSHIMIISHNIGENQEWNFSPHNVAVLLLLVCFRPILVNFSGQQINFKQFGFCPIVQSMIFLFNWICATPGQFSSQKLWYWENFRLV